MAVAMNVRAAGKTLVFQYFGGLAFFPGGPRASGQEEKYSVLCQFLQAHDRAEDSPLLPTPTISSTTKSPNNRRGNT